jgi:fatty acid desaturase
MPVVARVDPKTVFSPDEWSRLTSRSSWRGMWLVAHAWGTIAAAIALVTLWPNPLSWLIAVMVVGTRQLGLAILMHEAAHGGLHSNKAVNEWIGQWLCAVPVGADLASYRSYHLQHHKFTQQPEDPDLSLSAPFPITRTSLRRKIARDLTGQTYWKQRWSSLFKRIANRKPGEPLWPILKDAVYARRRFLTGIVVTVAVTAPFGAWWVWPVLWLVPQATWLPMITRLRNIAEHACVAKDEPDPLRHARTTRANWLERAVIAPYYVNYHCEHHMFMHVPCYNLPRAHRLLKAKGVMDGMLTAPGYLSVLRTASAKAA